MGIVRPSLTIAIGIGYNGSPRMWLVAAGALSVATLPFAAAQSWRDGNRFESILAAICFIASAIGFWSVLHIRGLIGDYQLFWLSILGVFDLAITCGAAIARASRWIRPARPTPRLITTAALVFGVGAAITGAGHLVLATRPGNLPDENENVRRLAGQMEARPLIDGGSPAADPHRGKQLGHRRRVDASTRACGHSICRRCGFCEEVRSQSLGQRS